jgi:hypothetical protein
MPLPANNLHLAPDCVYNLVDYTDVPLRIVAVVDGGPRKDIDDLERSFKETGVQWQISHDRKGKGLAKCLRDGLLLLQNTFVAYIPPQVRFLDSRWFGKAQRVLAVDPTCLVVDMQPDSEGEALEPIKRSITGLVEGDSIFLARTAGLLEAPLPPFKKEWVQALEEWAYNSGFCAWNAPGVRYHLMEHEVHQRCRGSLEEEADPLGLQSPTTPD